MRKTCPRRHYQEGFTLVELLVTLTIIGLLFGLGFANFRDYSRRQQLRNVATAVKADLRLAQERALSGEKAGDAKCQGNNKFVSYNFNIDSQVSYVLSVTCTGGSAIPIKNVSLPEGVNISSTQNLISFKALGQGTNVDAGGDVIIALSQTETGQTTTVAVGSGGEIK